MQAFLLATANVSLLGGLLRIPTLLFPVFCHTFGFCLLMVPCWRTMLRTDLVDYFILFFLMYFPFLTLESKLETPSLLHILSCQALTVTIACTIALTQVLVDYFYLYFLSAYVD